jgi:hypothetical protein
METLGLTISSSLTNSSWRRDVLFLRPLGVGFAYGAAGSSVRQQARTWGDASPQLDSAHDFCKGRERKVTKLYRLASDLSP